MNAPQSTSAPKHPVIDVVVDGHRATLVEATTSRALVYCEKPLKPEHRVRVVLRADKTVVRMRAMVSSAKFEMPKEGPRYSVELVFEGDTDELGKLLA